MYLKLLFLQGNEKFYVEKSTCKFQLIFQKYKRQNVQLKDLNLQFRKTISKEFIKKFWCIFIISSHGGSVIPNYFANYRSHASNW